MNKDDMKHRTRQFALRVIRLVESLPKGQRIAKPQPSLKCLPARQFVRREVNSCLPTGRKVPKVKNLKKLKN